MVIAIKEVYITEGAKYYEFCGLSTDTKPTGGDIGTGSIFCEVNTGKILFYNSAASSGSEWVEQFSFQS